MNMRHNDRARVGSTCFILSVFSKHLDLAKLTSSCHLAAQAQGCQGPSAEGLRAVQVHFGSHGYQPLALVPLLAEAVQNNFLGEEHTLQAS